MFVMRSDIGALRNAEAWDLFVRTKWSLFSCRGPVYREMICHFSPRLTADRRSLQRGGQGAQ